MVNNKKRTLDILTKILNKAIESNNFPLVVTLEDFTDEYGLIPAEDVKPILEKMSKDIGISLLSSKDSALCG